jgi:hypothetical protein
MMTSGMLALMAGSVNTQRQTNFGQHFCFDCDLIFSYLNHYSSNPGKNTPSMTELVGHVLRWSTMALSMLKT